LSIELWQAAGGSDGGGGWLRSEITRTGNQQKRGLLKKLQNSSL